MLAPFLSLCQDECPLVTGAFISLQRDLRAAGLSHRVVFVEATVDPGRDSVARLAAYQNGVRGRLGPLDRHAPPTSPRSGSRSASSTRSSPRNNPRRRTGTRASRSPTTSTTPTATSSSSTTGRERFVDASAPNEKGALDPKLRGPPRRRRRARPAEPAGTRLDDRRRPDLDRLAARHERPSVRLVTGNRLRRPAVVVPAALIGLALTLSACGGAGVTTLSAPPTTDTSLTLTLQHSPVGPILATGGGDTLYDFVPDTPTHSACVNDGCVFQWPPLVDSGAVPVGKGVDPSLVGTLRRPDGVDPALLRRPPALHLQPRRLTRRRHGSGHRPGRRPLVRAQRGRQADHHGIQRHPFALQRLSLRPTQVVKRNSLHGCLHLFAVVVNR